MINRRRFISIMAVNASLLGVSKAQTALQSQTIKPVYWQGIALGADAQMQVLHPNKTHAEKLISLAVAEVQRLEQIFSLYINTSTISQLNRHGKVLDPAADFKRLLSEARYYNELTNGVFDPSVQTLWNLYAEQAGTGQQLPPSPAKINSALKKVDYTAIAINDNLIQFKQPEMAISLNGIAQGYITDRVCELLHANGLEHAMIDMGEIRALGQKGPNEPWQVGIAKPKQITEILEQTELTDQAIATSSGYGTSFDNAGKFTHLFNPHTGKASPNWASVTVKAKNATTADALSTAFSLMEIEQIAVIVRDLGLEAWLIKNNSQKALHLS